MFVRVKRSVQKSGTYEYLQIVESVRDGKRVRQRVIGNLGRRDRLMEDGTLDGLLKSMGRFSQRLKVVEKVRTEGVAAHEARSWGPSLVFERLWQRQRIPEVLAHLAADRRFEFDLERACFALALQRLCAPGSDLQGSQWIHTVEAHGFDELKLQHFYRTVGWLSSVKTPLEKALYLQDRDLFSQPLDVVFIDTTSTYVFRPEPTELRRHGYSRDRRGDCPQVVLCVAVNSRGWPVAWDILPGNTADVSAFRQMIDKLRERFRIGRVMVVADRGMLSHKTVSQLEEDENAPFEFILGTKMRVQREVSEKVLARAGRYQKVADNLEVKEVVVEGRRYVVCRNPIEARKDAAAREAIVAKLKVALQQSPKSVIGNTGFKRFLKLERKAAKLDREAIRRDARLDGKFVLRTNHPSMTAAEVALAYKSLWRVERTFRETKSTLDVRPIFHQRDDTTIGHIMGCFLALRLEVDLQQRLDDRGTEVSWPDLMRDLTEVRAVELSLDEQRYRLRTELRGSAFAAFQAAGVRPPPTIEHLGPAPPHGDGRRM